jgi:hypothetical protein
MVSMDGREKQYFLVGVLIGACMQFDAIMSIGRPLVAGEVLDLVENSEGDSGFEGAVRQAEQFIASREARRNGHVA